MIFENTYDIWWIPVCLLIGIGISGLTYFRSRLPVSMGMRWFLFVLRALGIALLCFLLIEPFIRIERTQTIPPKVVVLWDESRSMVAGKDSTDLRSFSSEFSSVIRQRLKGKAEVEIFGFGEDFSGIDNPTFNREATDIRNALVSTRDLYRGEPPAGVILISDGIINRGMDPRVSEEPLGFPLFTIATGDTTKYPDLAIAAVDINRKAFIGNTYPMQITLRSTGIRGERNELVVKLNGEILDRAPFTITNDPFVRQFNFTLEAKEAGRNRIELSTRPVAGETNEQNNRRTVYIDIVEERKKVLLLYSAPNADIAAIHRAAHEDRTLDLKVLPFKERPDLLDVDLLVLHGGDPVMAKLWKEFPGGMIWMVPPMNSIDAGFRGNEPQGEEKVQADVNQGFGYFDLGGSDFFNDLPPLRSTVRPFELEGGEALFRKKVGRVVLPTPLVWYGQVASHRRMLVDGIGIWKWRMEDHRKSGSFSNFDSWINASFDYLSQDPRKDRFTVEAPVDVGAGQTLIWRASVLNRSLKPTVSADVSLSLRDTSGRELSFSFLPSVNDHQLTMEGLGPGTWTWEATAKLGDEILKENGVLVVEERQLELVDLVADHLLLRQLSSAQNGKYFNMQDPKSLMDALEKQMDLRPIERVNERLEPIIQYYVLWILVFLLLGTEWILRRLNGSY